MRRIVITEAIKKLSEAYARELLTAKGRYMTPEQGLNDLINHIPKKYPKLIAYTEMIKNNLEDIVLLLPSQFDSWYTKLDQWKNDTRYREALSKMIRYNKKRKEFYKHLVDVMRYDRVQSHIMPFYIEHLDIRTCVYCNAQYAISTEKIASRKYAHYELDHFKPKSRYPFLCVSFFNLQPSCANCNKHKSNKDSLFGLYTDSPADVEVFSFNLKPTSVIDYVHNFDCEKLEIEFKALSNDALRKNHEERFYISKLYPRFKKEASEILWLKKAYSPAFMKQISECFEAVFPNGIPDVETLFWGHDMRPEDVHKRPLNKLVQDLKKSL